MSYYNRNSNIIERISNNRYLIASTTVIGIIIISVLTDNAIIQSFTAALIYGFLYGYKENNIALYKIYNNEDYKNSLLSGVLIGLYGFASITAFFICSGIISHIPIINLIPFLSFISGVISVDMILNQKIFIKHSEIILKMLYNLSNKIRDLIS